MARPNNHRLLLPLCLLSLSAALTACGSSSNEPESNATSGAMSVASTPFSIGNSTADEMGQAPKGEMELPKNYDPYADMAKGNSSGTDAPQ